MGRRIAAAAAEKTKTTARHRTLQDGPKSYLGPPRESRGPRQSGTVGMWPSERKTKQIFMSSPSPPALFRPPARIPPLFSSAEALLKVTPPLKFYRERRVCLPSSLTLTLAGRQSLWRSEEEVDFTLRIVHGSFRRASSEEFKWTLRVLLSIEVFSKEKFHFAITGRMYTLSCSAGRLIVSLP